ncbi:hypothetical protein B6N60_03705 [Richelia sinica FACHB-800]|uniref:Uncharacterized protein n=1 Tax=Richelia sinica FACHB-800 TaxID=1357546 RepID=A0A975TAP0_9NOST|nr:hypothetical protein [Richelia sinica]MBD2664087.1 hypothetical protein [Richelia sinica FACHB-800]QXE24995.1 hypothetical protein B6N60_03705 [Richelia sinica FACHB-800]
MSIFKIIPWFSLALVLLSYGTLGWVISETHVSWVIWLVILVAILILLLGLTTPWSKLAQYYSIFLKSNIRAFGATVAAAFLFFLMLAWFKVFLDTLLMIAATILVKIDFQSAGVKESLAFTLMSITSIAGLVGGAFLNQLV